MRDGEREREIGLFKALFSSQISHQWIWERERELEIKRQRRELKADKEKDLRPMRRERQTKIMGL